MITKVIVIVLVCLKFDFSRSLPDIIRIGKILKCWLNNLKKKKLFSMHHRVTQNKNFTKNYIAVLR
jgi:hypothetical protein